MIKVGIWPYSSDYGSDRLFDLSSYLNRDTIFDNPANL